MSREKIYRYIMMSLVFVMLLPGRIGAHTMEKINVLVINSYDTQNTWSNDIVKNFINYFEELSHRVVSVNMEYLDSVQYNDEAYYNSFTQMLSMKYKNSDIDLILSVGIGGVENIKKEVIDERSIFYEIPVLFSGVFSPLKLTEEEKAYMTGVSYYVDTTKIINLIRDLHKGIEGIKIILSENDLKRISNYQLTSKFIKRIYSEELKVEYIEGSYIEDIVEALKQSVDSNYAILIGNNYSSRETEMLVPKDQIIKQVEAVTSAPIYAYEEEYINAGAIGGVVGTAEYGGRELARMAYEILLEGGWPEIKSMQNDYILNYEEIYKNNLAVEMIPKQSIIINKPPISLLIPKSLKWLVRSIALVIGGIGGYLIYYVYQQRQVASRNKKLYEAAKVKAQIRADFVAGISHDLKAPINVIRSSVQLIDLIDGEVKRSYLDYRLNVITQNANRLERLVANLIDAVKLEEGNCYQMKLNNVNIVEVIEDVCMGAIDYIEQRELTFVFDTQEEEIKMAIDQEKIERVILNLLSNAIKFTPKSGQISVSIEQVAEQVCIRIQDSGIGIDEDKVDKVFSKFYQVENEMTRPGEGSGIGLYIVKKLIDLHEGEVMLESKKGEGTTFVIHLPIRVVEVSEHEDGQMKINARQMIALELSDL